MFPLSQYDLPTHTDEILAFPVPNAKLLQSGPRSAVLPQPAATKPAVSTTTQSTLAEDQLRRNPEVDYTKPDLITLVFSDVGILTPEGVSQYLVGMFAG